MMVFQVRLPRRRAAAMAAAVVMVAAAAAVLAGCFNGKEKPLTLADDPARVSYLQELGWQVESTPVETLDLQLPQELAETWGEYAAMQTAQSMPFADYAGQPVRLRAEGERATVLENVIVRAGDGHDMEVHIDTDEANAIAMAGSTMMEILP